MVTTQTPSIGLDGRSVNQLVTSTIPVIVDAETRLAAKIQATLGSLLNLGNNSESEKQVTVGSICLGEGLLPVPAKLEKKER